MEFIPHPYQDRALWFMVGRPASALLMDMGLGKTVVTLTAFTIMNDLGLVDKVLIVAPLRVVHNVWMQEAAKWDHTQGLRFSVLHGKSKAEALRHGRKNTKAVTHASRGGMRARQRRIR